MTQQLFHIVIIVAVLIVAWFITERFSPDPLITKIVQVILFVIALFVIVSKVLPLAGVAF